MLGTEGVGNGGAGGEDYLAAVRAAAAGRGGGGGSGAAAEAAAETAAAAPPSSAPPPDALPQPPRAALTDKQRRRQQRNAARDKAMGRLLTAYERGGLVVPLPFLAADAHASPLALLAPPWATAQAKQGEGEGLDALDPEAHALVADLVEYSAALGGGVGGGDAAAAAAALPPFAYFDAPWRQRRRRQQQQQQSLLLPPLLPPPVLARLARSPPLQNLARAAASHRAALRALALGRESALETIDAVEDAAAALRLALRL